MKIQYVQKLHILPRMEKNMILSFITMYLDYAERQANRGIVMYMKDWAERLDAFLQFNEEEVLKDKGKVTHIIAKTFAENEFEKYSQIRNQEYVSDFDKLMLEIQQRKES